MVLPRGLFNQAAKQATKRWVDQLANTPAMQELANHAFRIVTRTTTKFADTLAEKQRTQQEAKNQPSAAELPGHRELGVFEKLNQATQKIREDAKADWEDLRSKFRR